MEGSPALLLRAHAEEFKNGGKALHETPDANCARLGVKQLLFAEFGR
jgi:hypothetical protein